MVSSLIKFAILLYSLITSYVPGAALHSGKQSESPVLMRLTASWEIQTRTLVSAGRAVG